MYLFGLGRFLILRMFLSILFYLFFFFRFSCEISVWFSDLFLVVCCVNLRFFVLVVRILFLLVVSVL